MNEDKARSFIKKLIKEIFIIGLFIAIAFIAKVIAKNCYRTIYAPPVVTEEVQQEFNEAIYQKRLEARRDITLSNGTVVNVTDDISFGLDAIILGYGDWKFDEAICSMSQLENINEVRQYILDEKADDFSKPFLLWTLIALLVIRYGSKFLKWLYPKNQNQ